MNDELISCFRPIRYVPYAIESPTTAYIDHGCNPQWNSAVVNAMPADESAIPGGGFTKCVNGSVTPKKIKPIPMPALNIIATQQTVLNSGFSPSAPNGIRPNRPSASHSANKTKPVAEKTNSQPRFVTTALRIDDITDLKLVGHTSPHARIAAPLWPLRPNITGSEETRPARDEPSGNNLRSVDLRRAAPQAEEPYRAIPRSPIGPDRSLSSRKPP